MMLLLRAITALRTLMASARFSTSWPICFTLSEFSASTAMNPSGDHCSKQKRDLGAIPGVLAEIVPHLGFPVRRTQLVENAEDLAGNRHDHLVHGGGRKFRQVDAFAGGACASELAKASHAKREGRAGVAAWEILASRWGRGPVKSARIIR